MIHITSNFKKHLLGATLAAALITPAVASAQSYPSYAAAGASQQIQGTIAAIDGTWNISVNDANGYTDNVALHQGTIINPTGLTLEPGMSVTIDGYADGSSFDAMEIDTPYQYSGPAPVAVYYGPSVVYPGYAVGWGPSFSLSFNYAQRSFERRPFVYGGNVQRGNQQPSGWQNTPRQYGYGAPSNVRYPESATRAQFQRNSNDAPQQTRNYSSAPQQQTRSFAAPAPRAQQQQPAARGNRDGGDRRRG